jgi:hypothetical protein
LQNSALIMILLAFSFFSFSSSIYASQQNDQKSLSPNQSNNVANMDKCDLALSYPKKIAGQETFLQSRTLSKIEEDLIKKNTGSDFGQNIKDFPKQTIEIQPSFNPENNQGPTFRLYFDLACFDKSTKFDVNTIRKSLRKITYILDIPEDYEVKKSDKSIESLKQLTNWKILNENISSPELYEIYNTEDPTAKTYLMQFTYGDKSFLIYTYQSSYGDENSPKIDLDNELKNFDLQSNLVAKSSFNKELNYDEYGNYMEYGVGVSQQLNILNQIYGFYNQFYLIFQALIILLIVGLAVLGSFLFSKITKIKTTFAQKFEIINLEMYLIFLIAIALSQNFLTIEFPLLGFGVYNLVFWQIISSLYHGFSYFKSKYWKQFSAHSVFIILTIFTTLYLNGRTTIGSDKLGFLLQTVIYSIPIIYGSALLFVDLIQVFKKVEAKK